MKLAISVPSGSHHRTLLLPLRPFLEADSDIGQVTVITPAADYRAQAFPQYSSKFEFQKHPRAEADLVITTTSGLDYRDPPILQVAKDAGIPTLTFVESWDNVHKMQRLKERGKPQVLADHLIVWNQMMRDHLPQIWPELGNRITTIGAPRLDYFFHEDKIPSRETLLKRLGFEDSSQPLIHFSTTELYPLDYAVKAIAQNFAAANLYASVHPGGNMANHESLKQYGTKVGFSFGRHPDVPLKDFQYNPTEDELYMLVALFTHSNLLINHSSSTALESFLADVPVINVKYGRPLDWWRWRRSAVYRDFKEHYDHLISDSATKIATDKQQLIAAAKHYLEHPEDQRAERAKTLEKMITTVDGTASQQVFDLIKQLAA